MRRKQGNITASKYELMNFVKEIPKGVALERIETVESFSKLKKPAKQFLKAVRVLTLIKLRTAKVKPTRAIKLQAFNDNMLQELAKF